MSLFDDVRPHLIRADCIADIGPGIRPQPFYKAARHLCIEPHAEYADWLESNGYAVIRETALVALPRLERVGCIFMLDVIEHMEKNEGRAVLELARAKAHQVVVYTPLGFKEQSYQPGEKDAWGLNGSYWQTHRSGWTPGDFDGWRILQDGASFFAVLNTQGVQIS